MFDSKYTIKIYMYSKSSIGVVMKYPEMLKFISDYLKTKKIWKHGVKSYLL